MTKHIVAILFVFNLAHVFVMLCLITAIQVQPCDARVLPVLVEERTVERCRHTTEKSDQFGPGRIMIDEFLHTSKYTAKGGPGQ